MAQFVSRFAEPGDPEYSPPIQEAETPVRCYSPAGVNLCSSALIYIFASVATVC